MQPAPSDASCSVVTARENGKAANSVSAHAVSRPRRSYTRPRPAAVARSSLSGVTTRTSKAAAAATATLELFSASEHSTYPLRLWLKAATSPGRSAARL